MDYFNIIAAVVGVWILGLSFVLYRLFVKFNKLSEGIEQDLAKKGFAEVRKRLADLEEEGKLHVQKVGLVRFNPFRELGGDHSFSLAILDGTDSGVILTGLHARDRTRIYMKDVKKGKAVLELSQEEKKALEQARK